eukprot:SAG11_NODE_1416_length_4973_cov_2.727329_5_plen_126_part_00
MTLFSQKITAVVSGLIFFFDRIIKLAELYNPIKNNSRTVFNFEKKASQCPVGNLVQAVPIICMRHPVRVSYEKFFKGTGRYSYRIAVQVHVPFGEWLPNTFSYCKWFLPTCTRHISMVNGHYLLF